MSLLATRMQNMREGANLDKYEIRPSRYGAMDMFMSMTDSPTGVITDDLKRRSAASIGNTLQSPVINYNSGLTIGSSRSVTIADSEMTSALVTITYTTYTWGFTQVPVLFMNNEIDMQKDFNVKFNGYMYKFAEAIDTACVTAIEADKSQAYADTLGYTVTGDEIIVPYTDRDAVLGDTNIIMAANDYFGQLHILGNGGVERVARKLKEDGLYNAKNRTLEYSDKVFHFTNRIANGAGEFANLYAVNEGSVGLLTRFEREALLGTTTEDGHAWSIETLPLFGFPVGTYYYQSVGDSSAIAGAASADMDRVVKHHYGFAVDVATVTAHNSDAATRASYVAKAAIQSAV